MIISVINHTNGEIPDEEPAAVVASGSSFSAIADKINLSLSDQSTNNDVVEKIENSLGAGECIRAGYPVTQVSSTTSQLQ